MTNERDSFFGLHDRDGTTKRKRTKEGTTPASGCLRHAHTGTHLKTLATLAGVVFSPCFLVCFTQNIVSTMYRFGPLQHRLFASVKSGVRASQATSALSTLSVAPAAKSPTSSLLVMPSHPDPNVPRSDEPTCWIYNWQNHHSLLQKNRFAFLKSTASCFGRPRR